MGTEAIAVRVPAETKASLKARAVALGSEDLGAYLRPWLVAADGQDATPEAMIARLGGAVAGPISATGRRRPRAIEDMEQEARAGVVDVGRFGWLHELLEKASGPAPVVFRGARPEALVGAVEVLDQALEALRAALRPYAVAPEERQVLEVLGGASNDGAPEELDQGVIDSTAEVVAAYLETGGATREELLTATEAEPAYLDHVLALFVRTGNASEAEGVYLLENVEPIARPASAAPVAVEPPIDDAKTLREAARAGKEEPAEATPTPEGPPDPPPDEDPDPLDGAGLWPQGWARGGDPWDGDPPTMREVLNQCVREAWREDGAPIVLEARPRSAGELVATWPKVEEVWTLQRVTQLEGLRLLEARAGKLTPTAYGLRVAALTAEQRNRPLFGEAPAVAERIVVLDEEIGGGDGLAEVPRERSRTASRGRQKKNRPERQES